VSFRGIVGHERPIGLLRAALGSGRLPHALLFYGPEAVGKATIARRVAMALLCDQGGDEGCGTCRSCGRIERGLHPDVLHVGRLPAKGPANPSEPAEAAGPEPAGANLRKEILVGQIRELAEHASFGPREGRRRVFLLDPADRMNAAAQNALLKTLEEPPSSTTFILLATRPHLLLPTIRSRSVGIRFGLVPIPKLEDELRGRGCSREEARARAVLSEGRPGRALTLDVPAEIERMEAAVRVLERLGGRPDSAEELAELASEMAGSSEEDLANNLELFAALLRKAARADLGAPAPGAEALEPRLANIGRRLGAGRAYAMVRAIERLEGDLRFNLNRTLVAEAILAGIAGGPDPLR